jgi:hypothetical protein
MSMGAGDSGQWRAEGALDVRALDGRALDVRRPTIRRRAVTPPRRANAREGGEGGEPNASQGNGLATTGGWMLPPVRGPQPRRHPRKALEIVEDDDSLESLSRPFLLTSVPVPAELPSVDVHRALMTLLATPRSDSQGVSLWQRRPALAIVATLAAAAAIVGVAMTVGFFLIAPPVAPISTTTTTAASELPKATTSDSQVHAPAPVTTMPAVPVFDVNSLPAAPLTLAAPRQHR